MSFVMGVARGTGVPRDEVHSRRMEGGATMVGGVVSTTVTFWVAVPVWPLSSCPDQCTAVVPRGKTAGASFVTGTKESHASEAVAVPMLGVAPWGDFCVHSVLTGAGAVIVGSRVSAMRKGRETEKKMFPMPARSTRRSRPRLLGRTRASLPSLGVLPTIVENEAPLSLEKSIRTSEATEPPPTSQALVVGNPHSTWLPPAGAVSRNGLPDTLTVMSSHRTPPMLSRAVTRKCIARSTLGSTSNVGETPFRTSAKRGKVREGLVVDGRDRYRGAD